MIYIDTKLLVIKLWKDIRIAYNTKTKEKDDFEL